jgi:hypothetical protein
MPRRRVRCDSRRRIIGILKARTCPTEIMLASLALFATVLPGFSFEEREPASADEAR